LDSSLTALDTASPLQNTAWAALAAHPRDDAAQTGERRDGAKPGLLVALGTLLGMHDLDELRRRLWLVVMVGVVGCDSDDSKPAEQPSPAASGASATTPKDPPKEAPEATKPGAKVGGMSAVVEDAAASAAAKARAEEDLAAAKRAAFAAKTCSIVLTRATATLEASGPGTEHGCPRRTTKSVELDVGATATLRSNGDEDNCCYQDVPQVMKGRPYMVDGAPALPGFSVRRMAGPPQLPTTVRRRVAAGWLHDAREELASVAAFERAALELAQVGAPHRLLDACAVAAAQEHRHAAMCLAHAEEFAGRPLALGTPMTAEPRDLSLLALLLETFATGCAGETIAAVIASRSARGVSGHIRATLLEIASDETAHAALAWQTIAWGLPRLTEDERVEFFDRALALGRACAPRDSRSSQPDTAHGRMTRAGQTQVTSEVWAQVVTPLLHDLRSAEADRYNCNGSPRVDA